MLDPFTLDFDYDVFISYSHADRAWVWGELLPKLDGAGLRVCIDDRDFKIGLPSLVNMERAVSSSRHTLVVLTPDWVTSSWADFESLLAGMTDPNGMNRRVWPLKLRPCDPPGRIRLLTYVSFLPPHDADEGFRHLLGQLRSTSTATVRAPQELSPFIVGPPITHPRHFFGRERELRRLFDLWKRAPLQNAALVGAPRSGKSSLLNYLRAITTTPQGDLRQGQRYDWLSRADRYKWIFVDFQDPRLGTQEGLLRHILHAMDLPVPSPCSMDHFFDAFSGGLANPTIIMLDELGVALERYRELDDVFWEGLRSLATTYTGGNLAFILATHEAPTVLADHTRHSSPFFNIFGYNATLGPMSEQEARQVVASSSRPFADVDVEWILAESGRWPILLQILCRERLSSIEAGETDDAWRAEGIRQASPFRYLRSSA